ncbi:UDP-glucose 4-epimerase GalE [Geodermatophilus sp. YIM 151500]|uniref:UDP-glucose 4-epimerase GalE n=1 Tax=Geodermatophilus sp. YIM 151500 TaxID=2984531 RepID=UPI0021E4ED62|nr:UDP-glucose 4-epimerase GalE [Geodermatophilus sp. YIM 151500]MCV2491132.1 UDP-glucose 4-epimerase GalE [Geodermatophilus sp. YIM 151500]
MTWLVTGGAGYIGSHIVAAMRDQGESLVVLDDLSSGDAARIPGVPLVVGSQLDASLVARVLREHRVTGVVHVAAKKQVEESVRDPLLYYRENVSGLCSVLEAVRDTGVDSFIFSSSAAVYGAPDVVLVHEDTSCRPVNPYGATKLVGEWMVEQAAAAQGLRYANLRYFNVAGAATPELADRGRSNLVPMVFEQLVEHRPPRIFGDDYDTPDGTCIRDFVHVADIADAHATAARALADGSLRALTANIGRGEGVSVREMVDVIRAVTGTDAQGWAEPVVRPRRPGDPARVVASAARIGEVLGWRARWDVGDMVASAWAGWQAHASGTRRRD